MKKVEVEYVENGTYQGGEEDVFMSGIQRGETCYVLSVADISAIEAQLKAADELANNAASHFRCCNNMFDGMIGRGGAFESAIAAYRKLRNG